MKKLTISLLTIVFSLGFMFTFAQSDCKVLKPEIAEEYSGKCKKGYAHGKGEASGVDSYEGTFRKGLPDGKGTYVWASGETYIGQWKDGKRDGVGVLYYTLDGEEKLMDGIWEDDEYIGERVPNPRVLNSTNVDRYSIRMTGDIMDRVLVDLYQNGARNTNVENYMLATSSGYDTKLGHSRGFEGITFPVIIKVSYTTYNKMKTYKYNVAFEFEIFEPGDWRVELHN